MGGYRAVNAGAGNRCETCHLSCYHRTPRTVLPFLHAVLKRPSPAANVDPTWVRPQMVLEAPLFYIGILRCLGH